MTQRLLMNYPQDQNISVNVLDFFWSELAFARSISDHELWLVSPWITESHFDLSSRGSFTDLWPSFAKSSIPLSHILRRFVDYGSTIHIVCRPPHMHVPPDGIVTFHQFYTGLKEISTILNQLQQLEDKVIPVNPKQRELHSQILSTLSQLEDRFAAISTFIDFFRQSARGQSEVLEFVRNIKSYAPDRVRIYYNYRLHAKILLGKLAGFLGSANITHSGFNYNDELFFYTSDEQILSGLRKVVTKLAGDELEWWKKKIEDYSILQEYRKQLGDESILKEIVRSGELPDELKETLELVGVMSSLG